MDAFIDGQFTKSAFARSGSAYPFERMTALTIRTAHPRTAELIIVDATRRMVVGPRPVAGILEGITNLAFVVRILGSDVHGEITDNAPARYADVGEAAAGVRLAAVTVAAELVLVFPAGVPGVWRKGELVQQGVADKAFVAGACFVVSTDHVIDQAFTRLALSIQPTTLDLRTTDAAATRLGEDLTARRVVVGRPVEPVEHGITYLADIVGIGLACIVVDGIDCATAFDANLERAALSLGAT